MNDHLLWLDPPTNKIKKSKNVKHLILINVQNNVFTHTYLLKEN